MTKTVELLKQYFFKFEQWHGCSRNSYIIMKPGSSLTVRVGAIEGKDRSMHLLLVSFPCRLKSYAFSLSHDRAFLDSAILSSQIFSPSFNQTTKLMQMNNKYLLKYLIQQTALFLWLLSVDLSEQYKCTRKTSNIKINFSSSWHLLRGRYVTVVLYHSNWS